MQIATDSRDRVHVVWDHGSDWYLGLDRPGNGVYRRSDDGGATWQAHIILGIPNEPVVQTTLGLTLEGNPLVVYRSAYQREIFFQYSPDGGVTWTGAVAIPGVQARDPLERGLDSYTLATDSANRVHLLIVGFPEGSHAIIPMLLHLVWDGQRWSAPEIVAQGPNYPMWPRAVVSMGNQLHATWFTYTEASDWGERRVWHSMKPLDSPAIAPLPLIALPEPATVAEATIPADRPLGAPPSEAPSRDPAPPPSNPVAFHDTPPPGAVSSRGDLAVIAFALAAVAGLLGGIIALTLLWRRAR
jgi:hypothetical protein